LQVANARTLLELVFELGDVVEKHSAQLSDAAGAEARQADHALQFVDDGEQVGFLGVAHGLQGRWCWCFHLAASVFRFVGFAEGHDFLAALLSFLFRLRHRRRISFGFTHRRLEVGWQARGVARSIDLGFVRQDFQPLFSVGAVLLDDLRYNFFVEPVRLVLGFVVGKL
jgi:hypothetical protein